MKNFILAFIILLCTGNYAFSSSSDEILEDQDVSKVYTKVLTLSELPDLSTEDDEMDYTEQLPNLAWLNQRDFNQFVDSVVESEVIDASILSKVFGIAAALNLQIGLVDDDDDNDSKKKFFSDKASKLVVKCAVLKNEDAVYTLKMYDKSIAPIIENYISYNPATFDLLVDKAKKKWCGEGTRWRIEG